MTIEDFKAWLEWNGYYRDPGTSETWWVRGPVRVEVAEDTVGIYVFDASLYLTARDLWHPQNVSLVWQARYDSAPYPVIGRAVEHALDAAISAGLPT